MDEYVSDGDLVIPQNFERTAPAYDGGDFRAHQYQQDAGGLKEYTNPQTVRFTEMLKIPNPFDVSEDERQARMQSGPRPDPEAERFGGGRGGDRGRGRGGFGGGSRGGRRGVGRSRGRGRGGRGPH